MDYSVVMAVRLPREVLQQAALYNQHVNGYIAHARRALLSHPEATDVTDSLRAVVESG